MIGMKVPEKIMIVYAWGRRNAGDHALMLGALELLGSSVDLSDIIVVARHSADDPISPITDIKKRFPTVSVVAPPFDMAKRKGLAKIPQLIEAMAKALAALACPRLVVANAGDGGFWRALGSTRLILLNGGNLFFWHKVRRNLPRLIALAWPLLVARRMGFAYGMLPQTCGPFEGGIVPKWIGWLFAGARFVSFRDKDSLDRLTSLVHLAEKRSALLPDLAFFLSTKTENSNEKKVSFLPEHGNDFFCVCLRIDPLGDDVDKKMDDPERTERKIISIFPNAIEKFQAEHGTHCLIVVQVDHDHDVSQKLHDVLRQRGVSCSQVSLNDPYDFIELYRDACFLLSFRLHSMIFALGQATPVIGIWRKPLGTKIPSMMKDMNLAEYVMELDEAEDEKLLDCMKQVYQQRGPIQKCIREIVVQRKNAAISFFKGFLAAEDDNV